jgi:NitT/TauT family transport system substrate-binding protein
VDAHSQGKAVVNMQLGWLLSGNQIGEVCAKQLGYYEQEGLEMRFQAGGPNIDGVAVVAAGRFEVGQVSSSPSLMLAASQDIPVVCFAAGAQEHPYAFFSVKKNPIREPKDLSARRSASRRPASSCCARCSPRTRSPTRTCRSSRSAPTCRRC